MNFQWLKQYWPAWKRKGTFTLIIHEPFGGPTTTRQVSCEDATLFALLQKDEEWKKPAYAKANGKSVNWAFHVPRPGETVELIPGVGVKNFTEAFITRLNKETQGGRFLKAAIVTETLSPLSYRYFVDNDQPIVFNGNTYEPLQMSWQDFEISREMNLPTMKVTVPNIGGEVIDYLEKTPILEHDIVLQLLHFDLLGDINSKDELLLQVQMIEGDDLLAQFTLGLNLGFQDNLPRKVVLRTEYPGLIESYTRFRL